MSITIFIGPMFSGKTHRLILELNKYNHSNKRNLLIKYIDDKRYTSDNNTIITNDKISYNYVNSISISNLMDNMYYIENFDNMFIDEGQFFEDLTQGIKYLKSKDKNIYISYLNLDYKQNAFLNVDALCHADNIVVLTSVCSICKISVANYTKLIDSTYYSNNTKIIGGSELFNPICDKCSYLT